MIRIIDNDHFTAAVAHAASTGKLESLMVRILKLAAAPDELAVILPSSSEGEYSFTLNVYHKDPYPDPTWKFVGSGAIVYRPDRKDWEAHS